MQFVDVIFTFTGSKHSSRLYYISIGWYDRGWYDRDIVFFFERPPLPLSKSGALICNYIDMHIKCVALLNLYKLHKYHPPPPPLTPYLNHTLCNFVWCFKCQNRDILSDFVIIHANVNYF